MDFTLMDVGTITTGVTSDGVRYLELFMQAFSNEFGEKVNPGCNKCISTYLDRYKNKFKMNNDKTQFRLHEKYENIPLEFGSPVLVNNTNITDEYAVKLLSQDNGERYFSHIPDTDLTVIGAKKDDAPVVTLELLQSNLKKAEDDLAVLPANAHHKTKEKHEKAVASAKEAIENFVPADTDLTVIGEITVTGTEEHSNEIKQE